MKRLFSYRVIVSVKDKNDRIDRIIEVKRNLTYTEARKLADECGGIVQEAFDTRRGVVFRTIEKDAG